MSRASQLFWYLNAPREPSEGKMRVHYTDLAITPDLREARRRFRGSLLALPPSDSQRKGHTTGEPQAPPYGTNLKNAVENDTKALIMSTCTRPLGQLQESQGDTPVVRARSERPLVSKMTLPENQRNSFSVENDTKGGVL